MAKTIKGSEVKVGDALMVCGRYVRIVAIRPYDNAFARSVWPKGGVRLADYDIGGGIALDPNAIFELAA